MPDDHNDDRHRLLELEREQWRRECRRSFVAFCIEALSARNESPARHHRLICQALQEVAEGGCKRLMILAPPGSAKTTYTSRLFPAWYFAFRPRSSIIACSHTQGLSELNSGFVQRHIRENAEVAGYNLIRDLSDIGSTATGSVSKERWYTDNHCAFRAGSVGLPRSVKAAAATGMLSTRVARARRRARCSSRRRCRFLPSCRTREWSISNGVGIWLHRLAGVIGRWGYSWCGYGAIHALRI